MGGSVSPLQPLYHDSCMKLAPYNFPDNINGFLTGQGIELSPDDRSLLGLILCLKEVNRNNKMTLIEQQALVVRLVKVIKDVKGYASRHFNENVIVMSKTERLIFFGRKGIIDKRMVDRVALGRNPIDDGPKQSLNDSRTPEGEYRLVVKNGPGSAFKYFLGINYPTVEQANKALAGSIITKSQRDAIVDADRKGLMPPSGTPLGGWIGIHGLPKEETTDLVPATTSDWTLGCIALEDFMTQRYYENSTIGTPVLIIN